MGDIPWKYFNPLLYLKISTFLMTAAVLHYLPIVILEKQTLIFLSHLLTPVDSSQPLLWSDLTPLTFCIHPKPEPAPPLTLDWPLGDQ